MKKRVFFISLTLLLISTFYLPNTLANYVRIRFVKHRYAVYSIAFSPDGKVLASGSADKTINLWDVATGKHTQMPTGHLKDIYSVAFSPDAQTLASGSADKRVRFETRSIVR